jgi:hypothetical protein
MDKLQPIIKQRFWILLGLSLILAFFAFFKNQSAIVAATTAREEALKQVLSGIPTGSEANKTYAEGLSKINTSYKGKIEDTVDELFASQQSRMVWPEQIAKELPRDPKGIPLYRDKDKPLGTVATRTYARIYSGLIEDLWKKAEPVVERYVPPTTNPGMVGGINNRNAELFRGLQAGTVRRNPKTAKLLKGQTILYGHPGQPALTWKQKVYIDRQAVPQKVLASNAIPSAETVWDCQEDIWFTELIFEAVRKMNKDADDVLTSPLKLISKIELRGGAGAGAAAAADGMMAGMEGEMSGMEGETGMGMSAGMGMGTGMGAMGGMGTGAPGAMIPPPPTEFDPTEVFGLEATAMAAADPSAMGEGMAEDAGMGMGMGMGMSAMPQALRWVALADGAKFRERGFYLSVIINQQRIPDFLVHLCESAWPTKVLRFQMGPNPYRKDVAAGMMSMGGMGGMGYDPAGSGYGESSGAYTGGGMGGGFGRGGFGSGMGEADMMGMMGMGGLGSVMSAARFPGGPPQFAFGPKDPFSGSLNQPDLVQLDIAGIITFYVSAAAAAETTASDAVDTPSAAGGDEAILDEAAKQAKEAAAAAAAGQQTPAATPTDGAAPMPGTTPPATGVAPATTPPAAETPTPMPPVTPESAPPATPPAAPPAEAAQPPAAVPATPAAPGT